MPDHFRISERPHIFKGFLKHYKNTKIITYSLIYFLFYNYIIKLQNLLTFSIISDLVGPFIFHIFHEKPLSATNIFNVFSVIHRNTKPDRSLIAYIRPYLLQISHVSMSVIRYRKCSIQYNIRFSFFLTHYPPFFLFFICSI